MDEEQQNQLDERLRQLALEAQKHPPRSQERQRALTALVDGILRSPRQYRPQLGQFPHHYEEIYEEALQELCVYICDRIDNYKPDKGSVMTWVNSLMKERFFRDAKKKVMGENNNQFIPLDETLEIAQPEAPPSLSEYDLLRQCLKDDPDDLFKNAYIENRRYATFQRIALERLSGQTWENISTKLEISKTTLSDFHRRCLRRFKERLKNYLENGW